VPEYLKAVTILEPRGNIAAEVAAAVTAMGGSSGKLMPTLGAIGTVAAASVCAYIYLKASDPQPPARPVNWPPTLNLKFSLEAPGADDPNLYKDQVALSVSTPPADNERQFLLLQEDGFYLLPNVITPRDNALFHAWVSRRVKDSHLGMRPSTSICLRRAHDPPENAVRAQKLLRCKEGDRPCITPDPADPGWLSAEDICERKTAPRNPSGQWHMHRFADLLVNPAMAATPGAAWSVPSLETLVELKDENRLQDGFTVFKIQTLDPIKIDADAVSLDLRVNDTPVLIEGLPADAQRRALRPDQPFELKFALQNLDFDGRYAGCDRIEARLLLYRDGGPVGTPIVLPLHYAALRDVARTEIATDQGKFTWSAVYELARPRDVRGRTQIDWRVLVNYGGLNELDRLKKVREDIGRLGLVYNKDGQNYPVVTVIRPPLSSNYLGIAIGIVEPTGQIRFTFGWDEATRLRSLAVAARSNSASARNLIAEKPTIHLDLAGVDRHYACTPP
jgi:hypothetical protein